MRETNTYLFAHAIMALLKLVQLRTSTHIFLDFHNELFALVGNLQYLGPSGAICVCRTVQERK